MWHRPTLHTIERGVSLSQPAFRRRIGATDDLRMRIVEWSRTRIGANTSRPVGAILLLFSSGALVGWVADVWWLMQPVRSFPALRLGSAVGMLLLGIGMYASSYPGLRRPALACAWLALVFGTLPVQHAIGFDAFWSLFAGVTPPRGSVWHWARPEQIAMSSAVFVTLGGVGLIAILSRHRGLRSSVALAASGGIVMLLATTVVAGQAMGLPGGVQYGPLLGSSLQSTVCAIVFATHFNVLAWSKQSGFSPPPAWLPLSAGAGSLVTVLFLWRALLASENAHLAEQGQVAASATRSAFTRQLGVAERTLRRLSRYSVAPDSSWTSLANQTIVDVAGLDMVIWADSDGTRLGSASADDPGNLDVVLAMLRPVAERVHGHRDSTMFVPIRGDPSRVLMVVSRCPASGCADLFVGVVSAPAVLESILGDTLLGYDMAIGTGSRWFRSSAPLPADQRHLVRVAVLTAGPVWELGLWSRRRDAAETSSTLSDFVLLLGIVLSVLLAVALRLTQVVSQTARLEERSTLDHALQSATDGIWEWDVLTGEVTRSPQLWSRLGYGDGAAYPLMSDWLALVHPHDRATVDAKIDDHLESRADTYDAQYRVRSAHGRWHDFIDRGRVVLRSPTGQPLRLLGIFADVTDRRHAEESLRQAETMSTMGRLAARIAHEINNPLAGIQNSFLLIKDAIPPTHPHFKYVGAIEREVQRISQVTRQLYETYRPETESSIHAPVQTVVGDAVAFIEQVNRNAGVSITVELGGIAAVVRLSDSLLRQCIYNLVQNAVEASPPGSRVVVNGAIDGADFVLRVRDQGQGVPADLRESIFDPFVSTKPSKLSTGGMGMGLSLVRRAVDAAGGSIEVIDADGGGAEFIARIPLAEPIVYGVNA